MNILEKYKHDETVRLTQTIPPLPLDTSQVQQVVELLAGENADTPVLLNLLANRVEPGVSAAAKVKAEWLETVANGSARTAALTPQEAVAMLASMGGGYNVTALIRLLDTKDSAALAARASSRSMKPLTRWCN